MRLFLCAVQWDFCILAMAWSRPGIHIYLQRYATRRYKTKKKLEDLVSIEAKTGDVQPEDNLTHTMKQINADYIGWITIGDTKIDYPIVHSNPKKTI